MPRPNSSARPPAHDRHRSFRPVADRPHPYRQCAHRAVQLAVRSKEQRPFRPALRRHRRRSFEAGICRCRSSTTCTGWASFRTPWSTSPPASTRYDAAVERLKGAGLLYRLLRDAEELELRRKIRLLAEAAAGLWPRGAEADRGRQGRAGGGRPQAALALPAAQFRRRSDGARAHRGPLGRSRARRRNGRPRLALRPGAGARGRQLSLHAAFGRRRHRHGHHPCHPRRRPCHQHRRADRAVQGAGRRAAGLRPPQSADHGQRAKACPSAAARCRSPACAKPVSSRWRLPRWRC